MTSYIFSSITAAQALAFNAASDTIVFDRGESEANLRVAIDTSRATVTVTDLGRVLAFGLGILGDNNFSFQDGSSLHIGTSAADTISGGADSVGLYGGDGGDILSGGSSNDVLNGGAGADTLSGGPGADIFTFDPGQSMIGASDVITDWSAGDTLEFSGLVGRGGLYQEASASTVADATALANQQIASGAADYVAVAVGGNVLVFADDQSNNGVADAAVQLTGRGLNDISAANIPGSTAAAPPTGGGGPPTGGTDPSPSLTEPAVPTPRISESTGVRVDVSGNMDNAHMGHLLGADITAAGPGGLILEGAGGIGAQLTGSGFSYDSNEQLTGGTLYSLDFTDSTVSGPFHLLATFGFIPMPPFGFWVQTDATAQAFTTLLAGNDLISGSPGADLIRGEAGNDQLQGLGGADTIWGGAGNDNIFAAVSGSPPASTYLRGEDGDDYIQGGSGFDDANGNMGNDTIATGAGDDYSVGGKDNDLLFGEDGNDIVWGNLGNDTCVGGAGADQVRGGQGDDLIYGGAGNDFVSGDRGNDTIVGGAGADIFHDSQDAGIDRVLDFNLAEGDRVMLDPGTTFTVSQVGADTVIDMGSGNQMILVGVQASSLPAGTIFLG